MLHLEQSLSRLISPQQKIRQSCDLSDCFNVHNDASKLMFHGHTKTVHYELQTNLPTLFTESGVEKLHALLNNNDSLIQDGRLKDNLTHVQRQLIFCHRRLVHMDMKNIKAISRQGLLPKEIANVEPPLCPFCIEAK